MNSKDYDILGIIEQGSAGALYHGRNHVRGIDVAFRRFSLIEERGPYSDRITDYLNWVDQLKRIQHKNVLELLDAGVDEEGPYLVHQLLSARNLQDLVMYDPFDERRALGLASQLLNGLAEVHRNGFVHGALHPSSILMMDRDGRGQAAFIQDLGIYQMTQILSGYDAQLKLFDPLVAAPERFGGGIETVASDLFAVGQIIYISLIGGHPFSGESTQEILDKHQLGQLPSLQKYREDISESMRAWIRWLVNPHPASRPKSAEEALSYLPSGIPTAPLTSALPHQQYNHAVEMQANRLTQALGIATPNATLVGAKNYHDTAPIKLRPIAGPVISGRRTIPGSMLGSARGSNLGLWVVFFMVFLLVFLAIIIAAN